jgi:hypothetical protein
MLDLSTDAIRSYWMENSPELAQLFDELETSESWVIDKYPEIEGRLIRFGKLVSAISDPAVLLRANHDDLLFLLVYISTSKAMRILEWLDEKQLGQPIIELLLKEDAQGIYQNVSDQVLAKTLVQRLSVARNTLFMRELLSPSMMTTILNATLRSAQKRGNV